MMATEERAYRKHGEEAPRCQTAIATEHPCPRPATRATWLDRGDGPTVCAEHAVVVKIAREEDDLLEAESRFEKWLAKSRKRGAGKVLLGALERALEKVREDKGNWHQRLEGARAVADSYKGELEE